jgi:mannose/fructose-specific phosphotransferase system component IIA
VTGVNLPMLLTLSSYRKGKSIKELGQLLKRLGRRSITLAKEVLGSKRGDVR